MFKRRTIYLSIILAISMLMLAACGQATSNGDKNANQGGEAGGDNQKPVTLTFLIDNQTSTVGYEAVAAEIEKRFNIKTEFELRPGGTEGDNLVKTRLATGEMTDLMYYNSGSLFKALNPEQYFVDLTDEPFMEPVMDSFKDTVSVDGRVYGVPARSTFAGAWLYNRDIYEELGLSVPQTWEELLANNDKIKEAGYVPVVASLRDSWTSQLVVLADYYNVHTVNPDFADKYTNNEAKFATTPEALRSFEKLQELYERGHFNDDATATTYEDALRMLAEGEAAHYPILTTSLTNIANTYPEAIDSIGAFGQPGDSADQHGLTIWISEGIYANKDSENVEAAKQWMEFFVSQEGVETYLSAIKPEGPMMIEGVELPEDVYQAVKDMQPYFDEGKTAPALEFLSPVKGPALEQITVEVATGISTAEEAAAKYDDDVRKQALQLGLEGWD